MPATPATPDLRSLFRRAPVMSMPQIEQTMAPRSKRSLFRDLESLGYLSSYSHTGRYYTLRSVPEFDADGIWRYQGVGFSRDGTLKATVRRLVDASEAGRTQARASAAARSARAQPAARAGREQAAWPRVGRRRVPLRGRPARACGRAARPASRHGVHAGARRAASRSRCCSRSSTERDCPSRTRRSWRRGSAHVASARASTTSPRCSSATA